jgi:hypothetical protein
MDGSGWCRGLCFAQLFAQFALQMQAGWGWLVAGCQLASQGAAVWVVDFVCDLKSVWPTTPGEHEEYQELFTMSS